MNNTFWGPPIYPTPPVYPGWNLPPIVSVPLQTPSLSPTPFFNPFDQTSVQWTPVFDETPVMAAPTSPKQYKEPVVLREKTKEEMLIERFDICTKYSHYLATLNSNLRVYFILDDSGSMDKYSKITRMKRWDELKEYMYDALQYTGPSFVTVLNNGDLGVIDHKAMQNFFEHNGPSGSTPLARTTERVIGRAMREHKEGEKVLIIICTDGKPNDNGNGNGEASIRRFYDALSSRPEYVYTNIIACTDDDDDLEYLNNWDLYLPCLDVIDDYISERKEVWKAKGAKFHFSRGDYIVKSLVGSLHPELDKLDESSGIGRTSIHSSQSASNRKKGEDKCSLM